MPVANISDHRTNKVCADVMAIIEDSWHDNTCDNATQFNYPPWEKEVSGLSIARTTIADVIAYVNQTYEHDITLYLHDLGTVGFDDYQTIEKKDGHYNLVSK